MAPILTHGWTFADMARLEAKMIERVEDWWGGLGSLGQLRVRVAVLLALLFGLLCIAVGSIS